MSLQERVRAALAGRYAVERELGHGGMAVVFLARDEKRQRSVAVKVLRPELAAALGNERFLREIGIAARLSHPHILPLFDSGEADDLPFYVTPFIDGASLRDRLIQKQQLPIDEALEITRQVASALAYAHDHDVVHRDIKPENILLQGDQALVADFGIARAITVAGGERLTGTGIVVGTPAYMSPEQVLSDASLDGRSDVYSLGCVLYEMLAGGPPFTGPTPQATVARRLSDPLPPLRTLRENISVELEQVIAKALARTPADRFATATEFATALRTPAKAPGRTVVVGRPRAAWIAVTLAAVLGTLLVARIVKQAAPPAALDANLIAVAPFDVRSASLDSWSEGLVEYLSRSLDGAGVLQTVSPSLFLRGWSGRADAASADTLGRRTGAGLVVYGSLVQGERDSVRLRAVLLDVAAGNALAEVEVAGATLAMDRAADSLAVSLLRGLGRTRPVGAVRNAPFSGASLPAIKEFLRGEHFYRRSQYDSASSHHARAIALDTSFALAYRRLSLDLGWGPPTSGAFEPTEAYAFKAAALNHGLTVHDSLLIAADSYFYALNNAPESDLTTLHDRLLATLQDAARRFPADPEVWMALGEAYVHQDEFATPQETLEAFARAIALDSGFTPAYEHVLQQAMRIGDPDLAQRYSRAYLTFIPIDASEASVRLAALLLDPVRSQGPEVARIIDTIGVKELFRAGLEHLGAGVDSAESSIRLLRALPRGRRNVAGLEPWIADTLMWPQYLASQLLYRGHMREAYQIFRPLIVHPNTREWTWFNNPLRDLVLWTAVPSDTAAAVVAGPLQPRPSRPPRFRSWSVEPPHWLPWWFAHADTAALRRVVRADPARRLIGPVGEARAQYLRRAAAGYLALLRGDSVAARQDFNALPDSVCQWVDCATEKLTLARLLAARGDDRRASETLAKSFSGGGPLLKVIARLERGRIAERLGERDQAIQSYQFVADVWRHADPELQSYVTEAREGLRRLSAEPRR